VVVAAEQLADEVGLANLTLTALAEHLGVRQPSLYKHVAGLAHLHRSLAVRAKTELAGVLAVAAAGVAGAEAVHALAAAYREWGRAHPGRYAAAQHAPAPGDEEDAAASAAVVTVVTRVLASLGVPAEDAVHATRALRSALHGFLVLEAGGGFGLPDDVDESFRRMVDALVAGLRR
jgi:AcrR family transcriptional regulator